LKLLSLKKEHDWITKRPSDDLQRVDERATRNRLAVDIERAVSSLHAHAGEMERAGHRHRRTVSERLFLSGCPYVLILLTGRPTCPLLSLLVRSAGLTLKS